MRCDTAFTCNLCGRRGVFREEHWNDPETPSCGGCGANVRIRWLVHRLSRRAAEASGFTLDYWDANSEEELGPRLR